MPHFQNTRKFHILLINLTRSIALIVRRRGRRILNLYEDFISLFLFRVASVLFKEIAVTCQRNDGGGAQLHGRISVYSLAQEFNFIYVASPIQDAHFAIGPDWDARWNSLLNFDKSINFDTNKYTKIQTQNSNHLRRAILQLILKLRFRKKYLFVMESAHNYTDSHPAILESSRDYLRQIFNGVKHFGHEEIVFHLRRGNDLTAPQRLESDDIIYARLAKLIQLFPDMSIRIYTNEPFEVRESFKSSVTADYSSDPFEAFTHMCEAKILIIAKSSLSYVAALINDGTIYYPKFWHPKLSSWKNVSDLEQL